MKIGLVASRPVVFGDGHGRLDNVAQILGGHRKQAITPAKQGGAPGCGSGGRTEHGGGEVSTAVIYNIYA